MAVNSIFKLNTRNCTNLFFKANLCHKSKLPEKKVKHFPYDKYPWNRWTFFLDPFTTRKMTENSLVIQIEGNVCAGKEEFGKTLADELGMKYISMPDLSDVYMNSMGFDFRAMNVQLPERLRICDWKMLHENPTRHSAIHLLHNMYVLRLRSYFRALAHLFNTGQGVVLNRSVFTECVIIETMHKLGWLPMGHSRPDGTKFYDWKNRYDTVRTMSLTDVLQPHLTIYLDVDPEECKKRSDDSPDPMIAKSKLHTLPFFEAIKEVYETNVLKRAEYYGHVVSYKKTGSISSEETREIIYDVSKLDFSFDWLETQFRTWNTTKKLFNARNRYLYSSMSQMRHLMYVAQPYYDIAGLGDSITQGDLLLRDALFENHVVGYFNQAEFDSRKVGLLSSYFNRVPFNELMKRNIFPTYA